MKVITSTLWVPGKLPALNEMIAAAKKAHGLPYARLKKAAEKRVEDAIYAAALPGFAPGAELTYVLYEPDKARDPGNALAGAMKFIEDALVRMNVLTGDCWHGISGYGKPSWMVAKLDGVHVTITGVKRNAEDDRRRDKGSSIANDLIGENDRSGSQRARRKR